MNSDEVKSQIQNDIDANGVGAITGPVAQAVFLNLLQNDFPDRVVEPSKTVTIPETREHHVHDYWVKGTLVIEGGNVPDNYGLGVLVPTYGIMKVDGVLTNEGLIVNNGLIIN
jgi:hypothetical protein